MVDSLKDSEVPAAKLLTGLLLSGAVTWDHRSLCRVSAAGEFWVFRWRQGSLVKLEPERAWSTPEDWATRCRYSQADIWCWEYAPRAGDVVVDVGAGFGGELFFFRQLVGSAGRVIGFEAHPGSADRCRALIRANGWSNVEIHQKAVADVAGEALISDLPNDEENDVFGTEGIRVQASALDDVLTAAEFPRVDYLKMNIEGAERLAVQGMTELIGRTSHLCISCHDFLGPERASRDAVREFLESHGFEVLARPHDPRPWVRDYLYARRPRAR